MTNRIGIYYRTALRIYILSLLSFFLNPLSASNTICIRAEQTRYPLRSHINILPDWEGKFTSERVLYDLAQGHFKNDSTINPDALYHWVALEITNNIETHKNFHLWVYPQHESWVYAVEGDKATLLSKNGIYVKNSQSCFPENPRVHPLSIPNGETRQLLIKINTSVQQEYKPIFDIEIRPEKLEMKQYNYSWILLAVISGILLAISFIVLQFWIITRNKSFMYYFLAFFTFMFYFLANDRVVYALVGTDLITRFTSNYFALFSSFFYLNFAIHFLDGEKRFIQWNRVLRSYTYVYIGALVVIILINARVIWNVTPYLNFIHIIAFLLLIAFAFKALKSGVRQARYFILANTIFFLFLIIYIVFLYLKLEHKAPSWVASSLKMGTVAQGLMFAFAIAHRFNILNREITQKNLMKEKMEKEKILEIQKIIKSKNIELETKVLERTSEIYNQKEELEQQAMHLEMANLEITKQKDLIEKAHSQITDSIFYASMIQQAVLPKQSLLKLFFRNHFLLFRPRDIISGDFYWTAQVDGIRFIAVADCTGHGVPGGFMSMLGISLLNEIVKREGLTRPDQILNLLRIHIINALQQESMAEQIRDGMVISLCAIYQLPEDEENNTLTLEYAGAHNPIYIASSPRSLNSLNLEEVELIESTESCILYQLRADSMPIAMHFKLDPYSLKRVKLFKNDMLYLFTDGITDQIGGEENKKFSSHGLRNLFIANWQQKPDEQLRIIENTINDWMNVPSPLNGQVYDQIDDICVMGIRV